MRNVGDLELERTPQGSKVFAYPILDICHSSAKLPVIY